MSELLQQPTGVRAGDYLLRQLTDKRWTGFRAAVAFAKVSGVRHLAAALTDFSKRAHVKVSIGVDCEGTSMEALRALLECVGDRGEVWVFHNEDRPTFHPKVYLFREASTADLLVGSANLTEGGLFVNYEASLSVPLDLSVARDRSILAEAEQMLDAWSDGSSGIARRLTADLLEELVVYGYVPSEVVSRRSDEKATTGGASTATGATPRLFASVPVRRPPIPKTLPGPRPSRRAGTRRQVAAVSPAPHYRNFVMTLHPTDVGVGQTTAGTSRRSPEVFVPLAARDADPSFWGWPAGFNPDAARAGKMDRTGVGVRIGTAVADVHMWNSPLKHDFRLRSEALRSAGSVGDVLRIERVTPGRGFDYYAEVIPKGTSEHARYLSLCTNSVRGSRKRWGYY